MSKLFSLNISDFWKGLIVAVFGAILGIIYKTVDAGSLDFNWMFILKSGLLAGLAYLLKQLSTNSAGQLFSADKK